MAMVEIFELFLVEWNSAPASTRDFTHGDRPNFDKMPPDLHSSSSMHPWEPAEHSQIQSRGAGLHIWSC